MRLPPAIELEIKTLESHLRAEVDARGGQHVGTGELKALRYAISDFMRANGLKWDSGLEKEGA